MAVVFIVSGHVAVFVDLQGNGTNFKQGVFFIVKTPGFNIDYNRVVSAKTAGH